MPRVIDRLGSELARIKANALSQQSQDLVAGYEAGKVPGYAAGPTGLRMAQERAAWGAPQPQAPRMQPDPANVAAANQQLVEANWRRADAVGGAQPAAAQSVANATKPKNTRENALAILRQRQAQQQTRPAAPGYLPDQTVLDMNDANKGRAEALQDAEYQRSRRAGTARERQPSIGDLDALAPPPIMRDASGKPILNDKGEMQYAEEKPEQALQRRREARKTWDALWADDEMVDGAEPQAAPTAAPQRSWGAGIARKFFAKPADFRARSQSDRRKHFQSTVTQIIDSLVEQGLDRNTAIDQAEELMREAGYSDEDFQ